MCNYIQYIGQTKAIGNKEIHIYHMYVLHICRIFFYFIYIFITLIITEI